VKRSEHGSAGCRKGIAEKLTARHEKIKTGVLITLIIDVENLLTTSNRPWLQRLTLDKSCELNQSLSRGQKLSWRAQEERVKKFFKVLQFAVVASRRRFLQYAEPDIHLLLEPRSLSTED
jgi:hypothetical protein